MKRPLNFLSSYFQKVNRILRNPAQGMQEAQIQFADGLTTVLLLILVTGLQKFLSHALNPGTQTLGGQLLSVLLAASIGWGGLSLLCYWIGRWRKSAPTFHLAFAYMGMAALPLIFTTLITILVIGVQSLLASQPGAKVWTDLQMILGWVGIALGWPGYFSGIALHLCTGLKKSSAMIIALGLTILFLIGWWLPAA